LGWTFLFKSVVTALTPTPLPIPGEGRKTGEKMNTQTEPINTMQATEAVALEDKSLPASETLKEQQADETQKVSVPIFVP
jgi:hypothetical protein